MKILVPVKRVVDYNIKIRIKADGSGVELANVKHSIPNLTDVGLNPSTRTRSDQ
jgi:electron transfer flavoprotein beta subunit